MKARKQETLLVKRLRPVVIGTAAGVLCCTAVLLIFALLMAVFDIPQIAVTPMAVAAAVVGAFFGGLVCARISGTRGLLYGAACGALMYLLIVIAGFSFKDVNGLYALVKLIAVLASSSAGGVYGVNMRRRR